MTKRKSVVFGGESPGSGCRYFRAEIPAKVVKPKWDSAVANYALMPPAWDRNKYLSAWDGLDRPVIDHPDVMTLRVMDEVDVSAGQAKMDPHPFCDDIRRAVDAGQIVLYDIDDDIWNIPEWSPAAKAMNKLIPSTRAYDLDVINRNIEACSGIVVSTPYLEDQLRKQFPGKPIYLQRPGIDPGVYKKRERRRDEPLRVGWMGSINHYLPHLKTMWSALEVLEKYGAEFVHMGQVRNDDCETALSPIGTTVRHLPWCYIHRLPEHLATIDIGIIPRVPTEFNEGQSPTSGLQYACAGIPFLVAPSAEYDRAEDLGIGKVCRTVDDWQRELERLLDDTFYRLHTAKYARLSAIGHFGLEVTGRRYVEMLEGLVR